MDPYETPSSFPPPPTEEENGYVNYYNPYVPTYGQQHDTDAVIIDSYNNTQQTTSPYYLNTSNNNNQEIILGPPVSEPSIVVMNEPTVVVNIQPTQKINEDNQVDPVIQLEISNINNNTTNVSSVPPTWSRTGIASNYNSSNNNNSRRSWNFPSISCDCDFSMSRSTKKKLFLFCGVFFILLLSLCLFGLAGAFYGVIDSDYYCYNDPNANSYVHQGCCNITLLGCTYLKSNSYCSYTVTFPILGSKSLQEDPRKGFGLTCSTDGRQTRKLNGETAYSKSYLNRLTSLTNVDCYTNKYETAVSIEPYSDLYNGFRTGAIVCLCFASTILAFLVIKAGIWVYVKWKE